MIVLDLVRRLLLMSQATELLRLQNEMLIRSAASIASWQDLTLETTRRFRDLAEAALIAQDSPEIDIREDLAELMRELDDQVARLEEHVCHG